MNNLQCIDSNRMKEVQPGHYRIQEKFSHCDRITDKTLPILFPMENVRSEAALMCGIHKPAYVGMPADVGPHD